MRRSLQSRWIDCSVTCLLGSALLACLIGLVLLAACTGTEDSGGAQSFNAHLNGSYTAAAATASIH